MAVPRALLAFVAALTLVGLSPPSRALAAEIRAGDTVVVGPEERIMDDLYVSGGTVQVLGTVEGDLVVAGGTITVDGTVNGDLMAMGGTITISGTVRDSARVAGGQVLISGSVGKDVLAGAGRVSLGPSGRVGRDVWLGSGSAELAGAVSRQVLAGSGALTLNGPVGGNVQANVDQLRLGPAARIDGRLSYTSPSVATVESGATVRGGIDHRPRETRRPTPFDPWISALVSWLRLLVGSFVLGLALVLLFPRFSRRVVETLAVSPGASAGLGCALLVGLPVLALLVFVAGLFAGGWWLAFVALGLYAAAIAAGYVLVGLAIGRWSLSRFGRGAASLVLALALGLVLLTLLTQVPIAGFLVALLAAWLGFGAIALSLARSERAVP